MSRRRAPCAAQARDDGNKAMLRLLRGAEAAWTRRRAAGEVNDDDDDDDDEEEEEKEEEGEEEEEKDDDDDEGDDVDDVDEGVDSEGIEEMYEVFEGGGAVTEAERLDEPEEAKAAASARRGCKLE